MVSQIFSFPEISETEKPLVMGQMFAGGQNEIQAKIKFLNNKTERKSSRVSYWMGSFGTVPGSYL